MINNILLDGWLERWTEIQILEIFATGLESVAIWNPELFNRLTAFSFLLSSLCQDVQLTNIRTNSVSFSWQIVVAELGVGPRKCRKVNYYLVQSSACIIVNDSFFGNHVLHSCSFSSFWLSNVLLLDDSQLKKKKRCRNHYKMSYL